MSGAQTEGAHDSGDLAGINMEAVLADGAKGDDEDFLSSMTGTKSSTCRRSQTAFTGYIFGCPGFTTFQVVA